MIIQYWTALLIGLAGSFHCVAMCSPLMLSIKQKRVGLLNAFWSGLWYQSGRLISYVLIGLVFFTIGRSFALLQVQHWLTYLVGAVLIVYAAGKLIKGFPIQIESFFTKVLPVGKAFQFLPKGHSALHRIAFGMLNGFLPCGLVYVAAISSVLMPTIADNSLYMLAFGLGTVPAMMVVLLVAQRSAKVGKHITQLAPYAMLVLGVYFVLRGMELGIPFVSPVLPSTSGEVVPCVN